MYYLQDILDHRDYFSHLHRIVLYLRTDHGDSPETLWFEYWPIMDRLEDAGIDFDLTAHPSIASRLEECLCICDVVEFLEELQLKEEVHEGESDEEESDGEMSDEEDLSADDSGDSDDYPGHTFTKGFRTRHRNMHRENADFVSEIRRPRKSGV
jgi:hypothetical protein